MVADARKHARMDTKIETKSISPRFGLSPMGPITSMYLIHTKINKTLRILFLKKNCENRKEKKNIQKKCKNMDEISKKHGDRQTDRQTEVIAKPCVLLHGGRTNKIFST